MDRRKSLPWLPSPPAGSLIFVQELAEKLVKIVEPRREQLDACLCFPSMPEADGAEQESREKITQRAEQKNIDISLPYVSLKFNKIYMYYLRRLRYSTTFTKAILLFILQQVMKQNKLGTFDLTQIAGGPLGNFAQQAQGES